jgi:hypothetical protein
MSFCACVMGGWCSTTKAQGNARTPTEHNLKEKAYLETALDESIFYYCTKINEEVGRKQSQENAAPGVL